MTVSKPYDESTADDFRRLFVDRFPGGDAAILGTFLSNPARRDHPSTGTIAYDGDGTVKAILGLVPRRVHWGQTPLKTLNGVAIARRKDADRDFFSDFIRDSIRSDGADLYFVNTAIPPSRRRTALALEELRDGPASCAEIRERTLRSNGFVARALRKILRGCISPGRLQNAVGAAFHRRPRRTEGLVAVSFERTIAEADFDAFWKAYLETNSGLVSSRTAEELRWMFGKGLETGEVALIAARRDGVLCGYAFCRRTDETATCWRVVDLIALGNDGKILEALIEGASQFLRTRTPALCLQITGYPTRVQPLLKRLFPKSVPFGFNKCVWAYLDDRAKSLCGDWTDAPDGWYGCPYDGDMCLM